MLNLVDRIENPLQLLNDVRLSLNRGGLVILALVLPYSPVVEQGIDRFFILMTDNIEHDLFKRLSRPNY